MRRYCLLCFLAVLSGCSSRNTIKVKGSDTEVNLAVELSEAFHRQNESIFVSISGGGSGLGIASLLNGTADIANSSRSINDEEKSIFVKRSLDIDSFIFAQDAIGFVVSDELSFDSISMRNLAHVLSGDYKQWNKLTSSNLPVNIYGRQSNSGTHDFVRNKLRISFSPAAKEMNGNAQIMEAIKADHSGIGYVGAGYLIGGRAKGLKVLKVFEDQGAPAASALDSNVISKGGYLFQRPLFQYFKKSAYEKIKPFIDFEKGDLGQKIIREAGYYPIKIAG
jgi:phosphate transport system substrate-binding protein